MVVARRRASHGSCSPTVAAAVLLCAEHASSGAIGWRRRCPYRGSCYYRWSIWLTLLLLLLLLLLPLLLLLVVHEVLLVLLPR